MPLTCVHASASVFPSKLEVVLSEGRTNSPLDRYVPPSLVSMLSKIKWQQAINMTKLENSISAYMYYWSRDQIINRKLHHL